MGWRLPAASAVVAVCAWSASAQAEREMSVHEHEAALHRDEVIAPRVLPDVLPQPKGQSLARVVYGYYPFWVADLTTIRWSALTHLAWFSVDLDETGAVTATHGWPDEDVVMVAHAADVRVDLTFTLFSASGIQALCTSPARRATAIDNMVSQMEAGGADGVSVDFESVNTATREAFVTFITELRAALDARGHSDAGISIAGPAVDWGQAMDLDALLDAADWYFVMGYGYFWSGSAHAGPTGMLRVTDAWAPFQSYSMIRTIADYSSRISADKRRQIIWGVPYYGHEWTTASDALGSAVTDELGAVTYSAALADLASGGVESLWDEGVQNPWYRWQSGATWHQVYYDDADSLAAKYQLAIAEDLGGVGMWALNYDAPHPELWDLLEQTFVALPEELPEGHRDRPLVIDAFPYHDDRDTSVGPSQYFNYYSCDDAPEFGREWVYRLDVCQPGTLRASVPEYPDADPDVHLLSAPDQAACIARAHTDLETTIAPGRYLLVVDTFVDMPVELEGPYALDVDFTPDPGTEGCAPHLSCDSGACVCADPALVDCGSACADTTADAAHCGACDNACAAGESCVAGSCEPAIDPGEGGADATPPPQDQASGVRCSCELPGAENAEERSLSLALLSAALLPLGLAARRRRRL